MNIGDTVYRYELIEKQNSPSLILKKMVWVGLTKGNNRKCIIGPINSIGGFSANQMDIVPYNGVGPLGWHESEKTAKNVVSGDIKAEIQKYKEKIEMFENFLNDT